MNEEKTANALLLKEKRKEKGS
jgi:hypothetical protein